MEVGSEESQPDQAHVRQIYTALDRTARLVVRVKHGLRFTIGKIVKPLFICVPRIVLALLLLDVWPRVANGDVNSEALARKYL